MKTTLLKRSSFNRRKNLLVFFGILVAFLVCSVSLIGCHSYPADGEHGMKVIPNVQPFEKKKQESPDTEVVLTVENRVNRIVLSSNRKRLILETRRELSDDTGDAAPQKDATLGFELWNIEFADARSEIFSKNDDYLVGTTSGLVAFDEKGERLFWLDQEVNPIFLQSVKGDPRISVVRGAALDNEQSSGASDDWLDQSSLRPLPLYLPWSKDQEEYGEEVSLTDDLLNDRTPQEARNEIERVDVSLQNFPNDDEKNELPHLSEIFSSTIEKCNEDLSASDNTLTSLENQPLPEEENERRSELKNPFPEIKTASKDLPDQPFVNVVLTKTLESDTLLHLNPENNNTSGIEVKRLKTSLITKNAEDVWLSPSSKWLVCHTSNEIEESPDSSTTPLSIEKKDGDKGAETESVPCSLEWALVPVRDRKRVVRFPDAIKMTFDSSTSDEEIHGRIVDVLAVSDSEDLVATLVEESSPNPRYKMVIWDLNVALKVNLDKARTPLLAIEVSKIALPYPISRKYCKFSPSGKSIAARIDPHYVTVWQSTNGRRIVEIGEHFGVVHDFEFSPSETKMVVGTGDSAGQVFLWEIRKGVAFQVLDNFPHNVKSIDAVTFSSNERFVYFANDQGEIRRWDIRPKIQTFD